ncbi:MAG: hypothetical protein QF464_22785 [Myxococcota bacterium]|nr:hypothetical protein [Myxococcota bacterium]
MGSCVDMMGQVQMTSRVVHVETRRVGGGAKAHAKQDDIFGLSNTLATSLIEVVSDKVCGAKRSTNNPMAGAAPKDLDRSMMARFTLALQASDRD